MGGRRKDFDGAFAMLDVGFILDDPRFISLTATQKILYIELWCLAVKERTNPLPIRYNWRTIAAILRTKRDRLATNGGKLATNGLINISPDNRINVCGIESKHPNLKWKKDAINQFMPGNKEKEKEKEKEKKDARAREDSSPSEIVLYNLPEIYNDPKLLADEYYATVMGKSTENLPDDDWLEINQCMVWAVYKKQYAYGISCHAARSCVIPLLEMNYSIEKLQQTITAYPAKPSNTPLWKILKPLEDKKKQAPERTPEEEKEELARIHKISTMSEEEWEQHRMDRKNP